MISPNRAAISEYIDTLPVFSDHEHHQTDAFFAQGMTLDKALANSYVSWTGFVPDGSQTSREALWENVRFNSYFTWFEKGFQTLHRVDDPITPEHWEQLSSLMTARYAKDSNLHWRALLDCGYERLIQDAFWNPGDDMGHPEAFVPTFRIDKFMYGYHPESIAPDEIYPWQHYGFEGGDLNDYVGLMQHIIRQRHERGLVVALKCAEAYNRDLDLSLDDREAADKAFGQHPDDLSPELKRLFSNYIFHRSCELAAELEVPFQIHTGLAELSGSNPIHLIPILVRYPKTRFVLFHTGYPWIAEAAGLAHNYHNVLSSLTWTATICTSAAVRALHDLIDVSQSINRITWGSDCWVPEESVGALLAWRYIVARVLAERMDDGRLKMSEAKVLARKFMFENGRSIYMGNGSATVSL